ncbi:PAS and ANTAR domain-containing protein [Cellulomonas xylanilytica]|uniref:ANTAR domain-containing protein n=1 Tax=Cellulomonas xylanilytica TaxID=233583 RepID=A0A510V8A1_9CELL|nr:PAS and ANTAR domain-containing protein [Cellulomonas xylanilytica]GEK21375.1 hypothetical protein CXY01_18950 [Cellulomonas xylanilytica]
MGQFTFSASAPRWAWSDGMFALHGMAPGDVVPTHALFLSHVHPEDRARVEQLLHACLADGQPVGCAYRLVNLAGYTRDVMIALSPTISGDQTGGVSGFVIDDTERQQRAVSDKVDDELQRALQSHAVIDQAKGILIGVYGVDSDTAFQLLRWASQHGNLRLRALAENLITAFQSAGGLGSEVRAATDDTFMALLEGKEMPPQHPHLEPLQLTFERRAQVPTLQVIGRVDVMCMSIFNDAVNKLMAAGRDHDEVVVDLRGACLGKTAVFVLEAARRRSASAGLTIRLLLADRSGFAADHDWTPAQSARRNRRATAGIGTAP